MTDILFKLFSKNKIIDKLIVGDQGEMKILEHPSWFLEIV